MGVALAVCVLVFVDLELFESGRVDGEEEVAEVGEGLLDGFGCLVGFVGVAQGFVSVHAF